MKDIKDMNQDMKLLLFGSYKYIEKLLEKMWTGTSLKEGRRKGGEYYKIDTHCEFANIIYENAWSIYQNISPPVFSENVLERDINHNLRNSSEFAVSKIRSVFHWSERISYLGS